MEELFGSDSIGHADRSNRARIGAMLRSRRFTLFIKVFAIFAIFVCLFVGALYAYRSTYKVVSETLSNHIQENVLYVTDYLQQRVDNLEEELAKSRKVYVYNLQEAVVKSDMIKIKEDFEKNVKALNKEIDEARKKIKKLEKSNVKKDFAELYLRSLTLKKDNMLKEHERALQKAADDINAALDKIIKEKKIPAIFKVDAIAYSSNNIIDVTPEVINLLRK